MRHFIAAWFHGNLTRTHYVVLAVAALVIIFGIVDQNQADHAVDTWIRTGH
jgi:hypothetical protein